MAFRKKPDGKDKTFFRTCKTFFCCSNCKGTCCLIAGAKVHPFLAFANFKGMFFRKILPISRKTLASGML